MLKVTIEIWPGGSPVGKRELATGIIGNDLTGTKTRGNYKARFTKVGKSNAIYKKVRVENFPRTRKTAWELLYLALKEVYEK